MPPAPQQQPGNDSGLGFLWIIIGIFCFLGLVWYVAQDYIVVAVLHFKLIELAIVSLFTSSTAQLREAIYILLSNPSYVSFGQLTAVSDLVGNYLKYPVAFVLAVSAVYLYFTSTSIKFKTAYNMYRLMQEEQKNWPQISPVAKLNLIKIPVDEGPWAMTMHPMEFAKKYKLLREETLPLAEDELFKEAKVIAVLKRQPAQRIFALQLGELWQGPEKLPIYSRALFAIFAARANHDTDGTTAMLRQIAGSAQAGKLDFTGIDAMLRKHRNSKVVQFVEQRHAYTLSVMASMLEVARADGVLASAEFLWLKPLDRRLWYMLNSVGRQTAPVEISGPFAHWISEKTIGRRLVIPMVEQATNALELALQEVVYKPEEPKEEKPAKKNQGKPASSGKAA